MKKAVIINASPRKEGSSSHIAEYIIKKLGDIDITYFDLKKMEFTGCIDCRYCTTNKGCIIKDDLQNMYSLFDKSDITITVTPIYFDGTPWKLKAMIDRMQAIYSSKYILKDTLIEKTKKRRGFVVSVAGGVDYDTQFQGNKNVLEFMYKSINTELIEHINIPNTDNIPAYENEKAILEIDKLISEVLEEEELCTQ